MPDMKKTLLNTRSLRAFCRDFMTINEVKEASDKLNLVYQELMELEEKKILEEAERQEKLNKFKRQLKENGLSVEDLIPEQQERKKIAPAKDKYEHIVDGQRVTWKGRGKMPKWMKDELDKDPTKTKDDFLIKD